MSETYPKVPEASLKLIHAEVKERISRYLHPDGTLQGEAVEAKALRLLPTQDLLALLVYVQDSCEIEIRPPEVEPQPETPPKPEGRFPWSR